MIASIFSQKHGEEKTRNKKLLGAKGIATRSKEQGSLRMEQRIQCQRIWKIPRSSPVARCRTPIDRDLPTPKCRNPPQPTPERPGTFRPSLVGWRPLLKQRKKESIVYSVLSRHWSFEVLGLSAGFTFHQLSSWDCATEPKMARITPNLF